VTVCVPCHPRSELALSLNDNNVNIYTKHGKEWQLTETLSEVSGIRPRQIANWMRDTARQSDHVDRLGATYEPHRDGLAGQERLCLVAIPRRRHGPDGVEANPCITADQPRGHVCEVESQRR